ncbi:MAG: prephenate dehydrogenase [Pseudomonadota bacterium]|nr:prephenate dehydrogenase [Pseudomonadota bacterium]
MLPFSSSSTAPRVGLIGFGAFGQLIARNLAAHMQVVVHDPAQPPKAPARVRFSTLEDACSCPLVILAVPVSSISDVCQRIAPMLAVGATVMDVGSVKLRPMQDMETHLPAHVNILGSHPLFGPQSAKDGLAGHKIALCPQRGRTHWRIAAALRSLFGLQVIWTTAEDHDREVATVQGLTHLIAQTLSQILPEKLRMTTSSFDHLLEARRMVSADAPAVLDAILRDNPFAAEVRADFLSRAAQLAAGPAPIEKGPRQMAGL